MSSLRVRMMNVVTAESDDFLIAMNCRLVVLMTVVTEQSFHEPRFSMVGIYIENSLEKNFRYLPTFL